MASNTKISFSEVWTNTLSMWSSSTSTDPTYDINMEDQFNMVGAHASIPDVTYPPGGEGNYSASVLYALNWSSVSTQNYNSGFNRIMISGSVEGDISNTFYCVYAGNYTATSFMSGTTTVLKNGSLAGTITTARGTLALASLAVGDVIHADQPISFWQNTYPGTAGAYGGYAGYCFATRADRYNPTIYIQNLSQQYSATIQALYTTTSDSNVTSMTSATIATINPLEYTSFSLGTTRNYYILSNQLICCHRGENPTKDVSAMYPLTLEHKYGWFSTDGHAFSVNNAQVGREASGGGWVIDGTATDGSSAAVTSITAGGGNSYTTDGIDSSLLGGTVFAGDACVIYPNSGQKAEGAGTLFGAESQADGNGGCGTFFTAYPAFARATVSGGGAAWLAFVSSGYSGSTPSYPLFADVIMRLDEDGVFVSAEDFYTGTTGPPPISKAYFGNGAGSGTYADPGDCFYSSCPVQGFQDTDASDKDETNLIMSNEITLPDSTTYSLFAQYIDEETLLGWETCEEACTSEHHSAIEVHSPSTSLAVGAVVFVTDLSPTPYDWPCNGATLYFIYYDSEEMIWCVGIDYNGIIIHFEQCEG